MGAPAQQDAIYGPMWSPTFTATGWRCTKQIRKRSTPTQALGSSQDFPSWAVAGRVPDSGTPPQTGPVAARVAVRCGVRRTSRAAVYPCLLHGTRASSTNHGHQRRGCQHLDSARPSTAYAWSPANVRSSEGKQFFAWT
eukprot:scaffold422_cov399-Prasinococcus_capsulatus_cf.AAC.11